MHSIKDTQRGVRAYGRQKLQYNKSQIKWSTMGNNGKNLSGNELWSNKEFWKDVALAGVLLLIIYLVYITVEYWPEITEGFRRGWNSR